jgi:hypothetical protein
MSTDPTVAVEPSNNTPTLVSEDVAVEVTEDSKANLPNEVTVDSTLPAETVAMSPAPPVAPKKRGRPAKPKTPEQLAELAAKAAAKAARPPRVKKDPADRRGSSVAGALTVGEHERVQAVLHATPDYNTVSELVRGSVLRELARLEAEVAASPAA